MVKLSGNRLKLSSGKIIKFKSKEARDNWEKMAKSTSHGFRPKKK